MTPSREQSLKRARNEPIPAELRDKLADLIEPHTMNAEIDHDEVMSCVNVCYPVICDWLAANPPSPKSTGKAET